MPTEVQRISWHRYFVEIARKVSERATCPRASVGCVIARDRHILSTGYNGSMPRHPHCSDAGCDIKDGHCLRTTHAELNAVAQAAKMGTSLDGAVAYLTHRPCFLCFKALVAAGVTKMIYGTSYSNQSNEVPEEYLNKGDILFRSLEEMENG